MKQLSAACWLLHVGDNTYPGLTYLVGKAHPDMVAVEEHACKEYLHPFRKVDWSSIKNVASGVNPGVHKQTHVVHAVEWHGADKGATAESCTSPQGTRLFLLRNILHAEPSEGVGQREARCAFRHSFEYETIGREVWLISSSLTRRL